MKIAIFICLFISALIVTFLSLYLHKLELLVVDPILIMLYVIAVILKKIEDNQ